MARAPGEKNIRSRLAGNCRYHGYWHSLVLQHWALLDMDLDVTEQTIAVKFCASQGPRVSSEALDRLGHDNALGIGLFEILEIECSCQHFAAKVSALIT